MRTLRYSINVTLDGCVDHREGVPDPESHRYATDIIARADALILGRVTYQMMEGAWRAPISDDMPEWTHPFAETIGAAEKFVVSSSLTSVDWNAQLLRGDLRREVQRLKEMPGESLYTGGVTLPTALAGWGLIDEYEFIVLPRIAGHGPRLFDGLPAPLDLALVGRVEFDSGAVALTYVPNR
ncbi:dihydrofolate reductase family protein [Microbacterium sp. NPDC055910]|uniref:dihydrofolate reductase family protein n=1 Tax=Microbacterium sp. NPDC055910 TaxID=3345659 RepID=UPI0035DD6F6E